MLTALLAQDLSGFSEESFQRAAEQVTAMLKKVGYAPKAVPVVPVSGLVGENVNKPSAKVRLLGCRCCLLACLPLAVSVK
jgi:translation elongation factor EF-1alpha